MLSPPRPLPLVLRHASSASPDGGTGGGQADAESRPRVNRKPRRFAPKVRTGCMTCRVRRVKCDEGKPFCRRCVSTCRQCLGYQILNVEEELKPKPQLVGQPIISVAPLGVLPSSKELDAFHMLCTVTIGEIAGCFDREFWSTDVLRATKTYPAIWHAGLAVAAMHQQKRLTGKQVPRETGQHYYSTALTQYNASIRNLIEITRRGNGDGLNIADQETLLLANVLFLVLCCIHGDLPQAICHAQNAIKLFYQWQFWEHAQGLPPGSSPVLNAQSLVTTLANIECQFINRLSYPGKRPYQTGWGRQFTPSTSFTSITDCYHDFQRAYNSLVQSSNGAVPLDLDYHHHRFDAWKVKFDDFHKSNKLHNPSEVQGSLILQIIWSCTNLCMRVDSEWYYTDFYEAHKTFSSIADLSEDLYVLEKKHESRQAPSGFSFSLAACEVMWYAAVNCHESVLSRRFITLLENWPKTEGLRDPRVMAQVAEKCIAVEEARQRTLPPRSKCACATAAYPCADHAGRYYEMLFTHEGGNKVSSRPTRDNTLPFKL